MTPMVSVSIYDDGTEPVGHRHCQDQIYGTLSSAT